MKERIQAGNRTVTFQTSGSGGGAVMVTFTTPFSSAPRVVATPRDNNAGVVAVHISSVSTTSFSVIGRTNAAVNINGSFDWIAFLP